MSASTLYRKSGRYLGLATIMLAVTTAMLWATPPGGGSVSTSVEAGPALAGSLPNPFTPLLAAAQASPAANSGTFVPSQMQGDLEGTPGLWSLQYAETLAPGQVSGSVYAQRYSRTPGGLIFTDIDTGVTVGVTKRLEITFATTPYSRARMTHPEQLSYPTAGTFTSYYPGAPFIDNPVQHQAADFSLGATLGILSQDLGNPIGLAMQVDVHVPYHRSFTLGDTAVRSTASWYQINALIDHRFGAAGELVLNAGYQNNGNISNGGVFLIQRQQFNYGVGGIFPLHSRLQGIVELTGDTYFGEGTDPNLILGEPRPVDLTGGIRFTPTPWMGINAGYRFAAHAPTTNRSGWVFGLSFGPAAMHPAPPPAPPTLACQVNQSPVQPGTAVQISSSVSPSTGTYTYTWTSTGGQITPSDSTATLSTSGVAPGMYTITGTVKNAAGQTASCHTQVEVREPVRHPPTASCSVSPNSVLPGATLTFSGNASSPDQRPLRYQWSVEPASAGHLDSTTQATAHLDTTGAAPGGVTGRLTVTDDRGLTASCSAQATIQQPPPPPRATLATTLEFKPNSSRINNVSKAALDDVALRLQQDASARAAIVGYATSTEVRRRRPLSAAATLRLAEERAANAEQYLVKEKGIASDRIELRHADGPHKAEVWIVPQGATYTGAGVAFDASDLHHR